MMRMLVLILGVGFLTVSCAKNSEANDLAKAQKCLDEVDETHPEQADTCMEMVAKYDDQQAQILKCAIEMTSGGLTETKIVKAYNALKDDSTTNKVAAFMTVLSLDKPDVPTGYTKAKLADTFCQASGVAGLKYISGIILSGTYMSSAILGVGGSININDPASVNAAVQDMLTKCTAAVPDPGCPTSDLSTLGSTVAGLSTSYCSTSGADATVCGEITSAVNTSGGNSAVLGKAMLCYLNKQTYNPTTMLCQ